MSGQSSTEETIKGLLSLVALCVIGYFAWQFYFKDKFNPTPANNPATAAEKQLNPVVRQQLSVQEEFESKRAEFSKAYESAENDIKKSAVYREANGWTKEFQKQHGVKMANWIGKLLSADTDKGGDKLVIIIVSDSYGVHTCYAGNTVQRGSAVYEQATPLKAAIFNGDVVYFSFEFKPDDAKGYKESSWTESGSICSPDFPVKITYIGKSPESAHAGVAVDAAPNQPATEPVRQTPTQNLSPDEKRARDAIEEALK